MILLPSRLIIIGALLLLVWAMILWNRTHSFQAIFYCVIDLFLIVIVVWFLVSMLNRYYFPDGICPIVYPVPFFIFSGGIILGTLLLHRLLRRRFPMVIPIHEGAMVLTDSEIILQRHLIRNVVREERAVLIEYCDRNKKPLRIGLHPRAVERVHRDLERLVC